MDIAQSNCSFCRKSIKRPFLCEKSCSVDTYCSKSCRNKDHEFHSLNCLRPPKPAVFICDSCPRSVTSGGYLGSSLDKWMCSKCDRVFICPRCAPESKHTEVCGTAGFTRQERLFAGHSAINSYQEDEAILRSMVGDENLCAVLDVTCSVDGTFARKWSIVPASRLDGITPNAPRLVLMRKVCLRQMSDIVIWLAIVRDEQGELLFQYYGATEIR